MSVNIESIPKTLLLRKLWEKSQTAGFFSRSGFPAPAFDEQKAVNAVNGYIDYFQGRVIKCDISGDTADPWLYDRDNGEGAFQRVVSQLRNV